MEIFVPKTSALVSYRGQRITFVRGRKPLIEEGHPILEEVADLVEPLKVDFAAPEKKQAAEKKPAVREKKAEEVPA